MKNIEVVEVQVEGLMGPKGEKGDPFTYEDFTEEQLAPFEQLKNETKEAAQKASSAAQTVDNMTGTVIAMENAINTVASNMVSVNDACSFKDSIVTVSDNIASVVATGANVDNIETVSLNLDPIHKVASIAEDVSTVSSINSQIKTVAPIASQIKIICSNKPALECLYDTLKMTVQATTLAPGSQATVTQEATDTGYIVTFGIPQGEKGEIEKAVLYGKAQTLSTSEKQQVINNLSGTFLPIAGGTVTGKTKFQAKVVLTENTEADPDTQSYSIGYAGGASLSFVSNTNDEISSRGNFTLTAKIDESSYSQLQGTASGDLKQNGESLDIVKEVSRPTSSSNTWKKYSKDGLLMQGGYISAEDLTENVEFPTPYSMVPMVSIQYVDNTNPAPSQLKAISISGFSPSTESTTFTGLVQFACGYV